MADPLDIYRAGSRQLVRSVLDRLLDDAPFSPADPPVSDATQVRELREAIRRDLELLLNTRRCVRARAFDRTQHQPLRDKAFECPCDDPEKPEHDGPRSSHAH